MINIIKVIEAGLSHRARDGKRFLFVMWDNGEFSYQRVFTCLYGKKIIFDEYPSGTIVDTMGIKRND